MVVHYEKTLKFFLREESKLQAETLATMQASDNVTRLGVAVLRNFDVPNDKNWFWIGVAALLGFTVLFNILFTFALMYLNRKF